MSAKKSPESIELTAEEAKALEDRLFNDQLTDEDKKLLSGLMSSVLWLGQQLQQAKLGIKRLKQLFGIKTEKKKF